MDKAHGDGTGKMASRRCSKNGTSVHMVSPKKSENRNDGNEMSILEMDISSVFVCEDPLSKPLLQPWLYFACSV